MDVYRNVSLLRFARNTKFACGKFLSDMPKSFFAAMSVPRPFRSTRRFPAMSVIQYRPVISTVGWAASGKATASANKNPPVLTLRLIGMCKDHIGHCELQNIHALPGD